MSGEEDDELFSDLVSDSSSQENDEATGLTDDDMEDLYEVDEHLNEDLIREIFQSDDEDEEFLGF